jgi:hypothetical protein
VTTADIVAAVKAQKVVVSNGPIIRVTAGGAEVMGHTEVIRTDADGIVTLHLTVAAAAPWVDVATVEVYGNGRPVPIQEVFGSLQQVEVVDDPDTFVYGIGLPVKNTPVDPNGVVRLDVDLRMYPKVDTWYVFVAKGTKRLEPAGTGVPFAYTNPIYVDSGNDGFTALWQK